MSELPDRWPPELARAWVEGAEVVGAATSEEEKAGRDSLGNAGQVHATTWSGTLCVRRPLGRLLDTLTQGGLRTLRTSNAETELAPPVAEIASELQDPFLLEDSLRVLVRGREFPGQQRAVIEAKAEALRKELAKDGLDAARRARAEAMLRDLDEGLRSTVTATAIVKRFRPAVTVKDPVDAIGKLVPLHAGMRIVYRVNPVNPEAGEEGEAEPMVFHVVAAGAREAVLLYTGGVHGMRHLNDLEGSAVHHAWFANRERAGTDATAPWIGRRLFRDLVENGTGEIVVHRRRDPEPIAIEKVGEDQSYVRIDGRPLQVPVIRCRTSRDDDLVILDDASSPLVLRLVEAGAELVRTIDAIHSAPGRRFVFPGDRELAAAAGEAAAQLDAAADDSAAA